MGQREYISLSELAERTSKPVACWYHESRLDRIPGQVRIGRLIRVHWPTFEAALQENMVLA